MTKNIFYLIASVFSLFFIHRLFTYSDLLGETITFSFETIRFFLVGLLSDAWVSLLIAIMSVPFIASNKLRKLFFLTICTLLSLFLWLDLTYVAFFKTPLMPFHLAYLKDIDFLKANGSASFNLRDFSQLFCFAFFLVLIRIAFRIFRLSSSSGFVVLILLFAAHPLHIRLKINWFVPSGLQFNVFEHLVYKIKQKEVRNLNLDEKEILLSELKVPTIKEAVFVSPANKQTKELEKTLAFRFREIIRNRRLLGRSTLSIVLLVESLRSIDIKAINKTTETASITPNLDSLAEQGILFTQAWSTGTVTRAGQEAVFCGYLSNLKNNLMRERLDIKYRCLSDVAKDIDFSWIHSGEGRFDNQIGFWSKHAIDHLVDIHHFPQEAPQTGWGVSDRYFLQKAADILAMRQKDKDQVAMLLTVTNHSPWTLPSDLPKEIDFVSFSGSHPSEKTIWLFDYSLGEFVAKLKASGLWENSLLIITGDHGIASQSVLRGKEKSRAEQLAHIPIILSGGITHKILPANQGLKVTDTVSQADVAGFLAFILGFEHFQSQGESLLALPRTRPVVSHLGDSIYLPANQLLLSEESLAAKETLPNLGALYYRAFINHDDFGSNL